MNWIQRARLTTRLLVILTLIIVPTMSWYLSHLASGDIKELTDKDLYNVQRYVIAGVDNIAHAGFLTEDRLEGSSGETEEISLALSAVSGDVWSAKVLGVEWLDLLAWAELSVLSLSFWGTLLAGGLLALVLTLLLGRVFCSWICPAGFMFSICDRLRTWLEIRIKHFRDIKFKRMHKYVFLGMGLFLGAMMSIPLLGYFYPPALICREVHGLVYGFLNNADNQAWLGLIFVFSGISLFLFGLIMFELFISRRFWCRYVCPGGALYSLFGQFRFFRIKRVKSLCTDCGSCNQACPMGLHPMIDQLGVECDNCFECNAACSEAALPIKIGFSDKIILEQTHG